MNRNKFLYLLMVLAVMLFVAISLGGCGGGSSSSGGSGTTSEDVANNPNGENLGGDDDYGGGNDWEVVNSLSLLDGTKWRIEKVGVSRVGQHSSLSCPVTGYNFNFSTLTFLTTYKSFIVMDNTNTYHYEPITVNFTDGGQTMTAVIIQAADNFSKPASPYSTFDYEADLNTPGARTESIGLVGKDQLNISCTLTNLATVDGYLRNYESWVRLVRVN